MENLPGQALKTGVFLPLVFVVNNSCRINLQGILYIFSLYLNRSCERIASGNLRDSYVNLKLDKIPTGKSCREACSLPKGLLQQKGEAKNELPA
jgi:hypothetical protein